MPATWRSSRFVTGSRLHACHASRTLIVRMSDYDPVAPSFDRHRALPDGVPEAIRAAILASIDAPSRPLLLDLGAGTGRIGSPFVAAGDDYVGVDLSLGMLREFARRGGARDSHPPRLVQADGRRLPFRDATFDAVMLIQVFGADQSWRPLATEARRVLRSPGVLVIGQTTMPPHGLDEQMKQRLASFLDRMAVPFHHRKPRGDVQRWFESIAQSHTRLVAAEWNADRTPRGFLSRRGTGARFAALPQPIKEEVLRKLSTWATATFGSLDAVFSERHAFELRVFRFREGLGG
jgi:ubiquinone/menaquinone biosynthesis C-methylase UbiE